MTILCHRCRHAIPEGSRFCPECGAPQLRLAAQAVMPDGAEAAAPQHDSDIAWPSALRSAALLAVPTALLLSFLAVPLLDMVWAFGGAVWTIRRYRSRAPRSAPLTPQFGGRIGFVLGLFAAVFTTALQSVSLVVERYGLHRGAAIDGPLQQQVQQAFSRINAMKTDGASQLPGLYHFWLSPEGQGALVVISAAASALSIIFFAWLGGRFAVRYGWVRRLRNQN